MRIPLLAAICVALVIALAGCGSSGGSSTTSSAAATTTAVASTPATTATATTAPSTTTSPAGTSTQSVDQLLKSPEHKKYISERIDPVCEAYNRTIQGVQSKLQGLAAKEQSTGNLKLFVPALQEAQAAAARAAQSFVAAAPPVNETRQAAVVGKVLAAQVQLDSLLVLAAKKNDKGRFTTISGTASGFAGQSQALQKAFGMNTICGAAG